jgi:uncharacterized membrane protein
MKRLAIVLVMLSGFFFGIGTAGSDPGDSLGDQGVARTFDLGPADFPLFAQAGSSPDGAAFTDVAAVIDKYHCTVCHAGAEPRDGLRLDNYGNVMKGGKDGPVVVPGKPEKSELVLRVKGTREPRMPIAGPPWLSDEEVKTIESWISAGAKGPKS